MEISYQQARNAAWESVRDRGWDYVDPSPPPKYFRGFRPSCQVGYVLHVLGKKFMVGYRNRLSIQQLFTLSFYKPTEEAMCFLTVLQKNNDCGVAWGPGYLDAIEMTLMRYPELRPPDPAKQALELVQTR